MFLDKPILGHGPRMFRKICQTPKYYLGDRSCTTHPHNILAQFLSELGLIGFLFYLIFFIWILYKLFIIIYFPTINNIFEKILLSGFIVYLLPFVTSGSFFNNWMGIIFFLPLGFYLSKNNFNK
jgi:O-antigen ligase